MAVAGDGFRLRASGLDPDREPGLEGAFTVGNGWAGTRGAVEEGGARAAPRTYLAGVFSPPHHDRSPPPEGSLAPSLVGAPDWTSLHLEVDGTPVRPEVGQVLEHERVLDLSQGLLERRWVQRLPSGQVVRLLLRRWALLGTRCSFLQEASVTLDEGRARVRAQAALRPDPDAEGWHWQHPGGGRVLVRQETGPVVVVAAQRWQLDERHAAEDGAGHRVAWDCRSGRAYRLVRLVACEASLWSQDPAAAAVARVDVLHDLGPQALLSSHRRLWRDRWRRADVELEGDEECQRALRFALFHLMAAAPPGEMASVSARTLSGAKYHGHVLWDADIYVLPFYAFTFPRAARTMLGYRHRTLDEARTEASRLGHQGALYAWESAATGHEVTPLCEKGVAMVTGQRAHHVAADVAYAVCTYHVASGDEPYLLEQGAEIVLETARFWASRVERDGAGGAHIRHVVGPDEYHEDVDDSAYTNAMARWNLEAAVSMSARLAERHPARWSQLAEALGISGPETARWREIAAAMVVRHDPGRSHIEEFAGYDQLDDVDLRQLATGGGDVQAVLGRDRTAATQIVKQADVVLVLLLLPEHFGEPALGANLDHYEPRTDPAGSSLSPSMQALAALRAGRPRVARRWLDRALAVDLGDAFAGAAHGVHAAACGGLWQAVVCGAGGIRARGRTLTVQPALLPEWRRLRVPIRWRGRWLSITATPDTVRVEMLEGEAVTAEVGGGRTVRLSSDQPLEIGVRPDAPVRLRG
jgi:trehalose/maltose hydrolase-like predicted phosphorylase